MGEPEAREAEGKGKWLTPSSLLNPFRGPQVCERAGCLAARDLTLIGPQMEGARLVRREDNRGFFARRSFIFKGGVNQAGGNSGC